MRALIFRLTFEETLYDQGYDALVVEYNEALLRTLKRLDHQYNKVLEQVDLPEMCSLKTHFRQEVYTFDMNATFDIGRQEHGMPPVGVITDVDPEDVWGEELILTETFNPKALKKAKDIDLPVYAEHCFLHVSKWDPTAETPARLYLSGWTRSDRTFETNSFRIQDILDAVERGPNVQEKAS